MSSVSCAMRGAALRRHVLERAHVVQPVGELDQQHAHVVGDGEQELAQVLGLLGLARDQVEPLQLGQALDQMADVGAEDLVDLGARGRRVLDGVVQQRRRDRGVVELEVGQDRRDLERMGEIRIARGALLLAVRLHGVDIGAVEQRLVGVRVVAADPLDQIVLPHHRGGLLGLLGLGGRQACEPTFRPRSSRRPGSRRVLHARQISLRTGHDDLPHRISRAIRWLRKAAAGKAVHEMRTARPAECGSRTATADGRAADSQSRTLFGVVGLGLLLGRAPGPRGP